MEFTKLRRWRLTRYAWQHADGHFKVGQVVKYSDVLPAAPPVVLADSFEQLLLIAGNLQEIRDKRETSRALSEFRAYLAPLLLSARRHGISVGGDRQRGARMSWTVMVSWSIEY